MILLREILQCGINIFNNNTVLYWKRQAGAKIWKDVSMHSFPIRNRKGFAV